MRLIGNLTRTLHRFGKKYGSAIVLSAACTTAATVSAPVVSKGGQQSAFAFAPTGTPTNSPSPSQSNITSLRPTPSPSPFYEIGFGLWGAVFVAVLGFFILSLMVGLLAPYMFMKCVLFCFVLCILRERSTLLTVLLKSYFS